MTRRRNHGRSAVFGRNRLSHTKDTKDSVRLMRPCDKPAAKAISRPDGLPTRLLSRGSRDILWLSKFI
jgi:hypothetical protein